MSVVTISTNIRKANNNQLFRTLCFAPMNIVKLSARNFVGGVNYVPVFLSNMAGTLKIAVVSVTGCILTGQPF